MSNISTIRHNSFRTFVYKSYLLLKLSLNRDDIYIDTEINPWKVLNVSTNPLTTN